jgi:hypothetical protein
MPSERGLLEFSNIKEAAAEAVEAMAVAPTGSG